MFLPVISVDICRWQSVTNESSVHSNWGRHLFISISQWQGLAGAVLPSPPPASSHWSAGQGVVITRRWEVRVSSVTPHSYLLSVLPPSPVRAVTPDSQTWSVSWEEPSILPSLTYHYAHLCFRWWWDLLLWPDSGQSCRVISSLSVMFREPQHSPAGW